jgi:hypothetical protein
MFLFRRKAISPHKSSDNITPVSLLDFWQISKIQQNIFFTLSNDFIPQILLSFNNFLNVVS